MSKITDPAVLASIDFLNGYWEALGSLAPTRGSREEQSAIIILAAYIRAQPLGV